MRDSGVEKIYSDPPIPDWNAIVLPDTWPDTLGLNNLAGIWRVVRQVLSKKRDPVELPAEMPGIENIPKYVLQEFHNLPNGNYSKNITRGYITGFERVMMGTMRTARARVAQELRNCYSVLDVGCAGGSMAGAVKRAGVDEVWGLDPSPYLLQHAAKDYPDIKFVQGVAENTNYPNDRFDGVTASFLLHEMPPRYIDSALVEFHRILKPGGLLGLLEPSALQIQASLFYLFKHLGFSGVYFGILARLVNEPFLCAWHQYGISAKLEQFGFELSVDENEYPIRRLVAKKIAS